MPQPKAFVTFLWRGHGWPAGKTVPRYTVAHVNTLASMLRRHGGHSLTCVTTHPDGVAPEIAVIRMPEDVAALPGYYPKVWAFSEELSAAIGRRFTVIDLDAVVLGDLGPLVDRKGDFIVWNQARGEPYNTSFLTMDPHAHVGVWSAFTPARAALAQAVCPRWTGDQSWLGYCLGPGAQTYSEADGLIQYRPSRDRAAPASGALAYFLCGPYDPASEAESSPWIQEAYR